MHSVLHFYDLHPRLYAKSYFQLIPPSLPPHTGVHSIVLCPCSHILYPPHDIGHCVNLFCGMIRADFVTVFVHSGSCWLNVVCVRRLFRINGQVLSQPLSRCSCSTVPEMPMHVSLQSIHRRGGVVSLPPQL